MNNFLNKIYKKNINNKIRQKKKEIRNFYINQLFKSYFLLLLNYYNIKKITSNYQLLLKVNLKL